MTHAHQLSLQVSTACLAWRRVSKLSMSRRSSNANQSLLTIFPSAPSPAPSRSTSATSRSALCTSLCYCCNCPSGPAPHQCALPGVHLVAAQLTGHQCSQGEPHTKRLLLFHHRLQSLIQRLPPLNFAILRHMSHHLRRIALNSDVNKMTTTNLGELTLHDMQLRLRNDCRACVWPDGCPLERHHRLDAPEHAVIVRVADGRHDHPLRRAVWRRLVLRRQHRIARAYEHGRFALLIHGGCRLSSSTRAVMRPPTTSATTATTTTSRMPDMMSDLIAFTCFGLFHEKRNKSKVGGLLAPPVCAQDAELSAAGKL